MFIPCKGPIIPNVVKPTRPTCINKMLLNIFAETSRQIYNNKDWRLFKCWSALLNEATKTSSNFRHALL